MLEAKGDFCHNIRLFLTEAKRRRGITVQY